MSTTGEDLKTASEKLHFRLLSSFISRRTTQVRSIFAGVAIIDQTVISKLVQLLKGRQ